MVRRAVLAPFRSIIAFVARVVPCMMKSTSLGFKLLILSTFFAAVKKPASGLSFVVSTFAVNRCLLCSNTASVKVPPMSIARLTVIELTFRDFQNFVLISA